MGPDMISELIYEIFIAIREAHRNFMAHLPDDNYDEIKITEVSECIIYAAISAIKVLMKKEKLNVDEMAKCKELIIDYTNTILKIGSK